MELFNYLLKVSACSALFFAFYLLVLRKLTFFKSNRFYLLFSVLISFIIPALQFTIETEVEQRAAIVQPVAFQDVDLGGASFKVPVVVGTGPIDHDVVSFDWLILLPYLYSSIVACLLVLSAWRLFQLVKHTKAPVKEINGLKLVAKQKGFTNCSFFNYIFIDENSLTQAELAVLLAHEEVHAKQYHSVDKLILMIAKAVLWFNPIIYLYDRAIEEVHEYEADETTSENVGTESYATLLLKLAVSKNSNPFIHNFVKSPIKQRIKMLFNSKSKNMKKLAYLLALPIGLGLIWGFTVKITHRVKPFVQQETPQLQDTLPGKTLKGKVISFERLKMTGEVLNLQVGSTIVPISCYSFKDKVKIGDEISVAIGGKSFPPPVVSTTTTDTKGNKSVSTEKTAYMVSKVMGANGKTIYELPKYAFLYEANRARFAWSTIKSIEKSANGAINKIVLLDKHGFTINLNVTAQHFKSNDFKKGDPIVVKFIGEKLTGAKTYTTDKMIALYSWPKKYELINSTLYPKFYDENGKQKVYNGAGQPKIGQDTKASNIPIKVYPKPILFSSSSVKVNNKTKINYFQDARMKLFDGELEAKEVEMDMVQDIITAKQAKFKDENGNVIESDVMVFNNKTGAFTATNASKNAAFELLSKLNYSALDSVKVIRVMDKVIMLNGKVKLKIDNYAINARVVTASKGSNVLTIHRGSLKDGNGPVIRTERMEFDVITKEAYYGDRP